MSIRKILLPLLIISYVCGLRIVEFPIGVPRKWFSLLYMLLLWSLYNFIFIYIIIPNTIHYSTLYHVWFGINMFIAFLSIIIGIHYDKTFRNCIKNLIAIDNTLEKLGITTDYKLYMRTIWLILGWFIVAILIICLYIPFLRSNDDISEAIYIPFMQIYCIHINIITDLIITSMLGYIALKFDQINEHLEKLTNDKMINKRRRKQDRKDSTLLFHQFKCIKAPKNAHIIWIVMHLHLELRKISRKIDLIFGTQMTMEMGCYFAFIALDIQEIFHAIFLEDYHNKRYYIIMLIVWFFLHIFRLFLINYECDKVSIKANVTGNFISKFSYSNVEIRENILQFLLMTQSPIRFCGLGFFEFGFKFLQNFIASVATVVVILLQPYIKKYVYF